jgi:imidazolonepropionase-like amidohydrolase
MHVINPVILLIALVVSGVSAAAAEGARVAIRAAHLLDVRRGVTVDDAVVVIDGNRIATVGNEVPEGVTVHRPRIGDASAGADRHAHAPQCGRERPRQGAECDDGVA